MSAETSFENPTASTLDIVAANNSSDANETELVARARDGSFAAIEELVRRYERRLFRLAQNITANHEDAEEVVQDAFIKAFKNLAGFRGESCFYTWLVRIAVNEALMKTRRRRFRELSIDVPSNETENQGYLNHELKDWGPNPEERYSQEELRRILETAIRELGPGYSVVFQLRDIEGFSIEETARTLDLSTAVVKARLRRARFWLRNSLDVYFQTADSSERHPRSFNLRGAGRGPTLPKSTVRPISRV